MKRLDSSTTRRLLLWYFDGPSNDPYVSLTFDVDVGPLRVFLDAFEREHGERVGVQHAVSKAVARCLGEVPALNVKIFGHAIHALDHVHLAMPVHLGGAGKKADETGMVVVHDVDRMSLLEVARATRAVAEKERDGRAALSGSALARKAARFVPDALLRAGLDATSSLLARPTMHRVFGGSLSVSSAVTNVGSVFALPRGARFRALSASIPAKLSHVASVFGVAPAEQAAVVEDGAIVARTVLPIVMIVDHRAVDGVLMATAASKVANSLLEPTTLDSPRV